MLGTRSVTTTGHGRVTLPRSTAVVRVAATHRAASLSEALAGAESARAAVVGIALRHLDPARVATRSLDVWPAHDQAGRPAGHEARHSLTLRCDDLAVAGTLVQALADEVGDRLVVDGVSLSATPGPDDVRTARERAYADARATAAHLASLAGAGLGAPTAVVEGGAGAGSPPRDAFLAATAEDVSLAAGEEDVTASVTITWELV